MKKLAFLFSFVMALLIANGQVTQWQELRKDSAYKSFQVKLAALSKMAKGGQTNFEAIKKLFAENKSRLQTLATKYKIVRTSVSGNGATSNAKKHVPPVRGVRVVANSTFSYKPPFTIMDVLNSSQYVRQYTSLNFISNEAKAIFSFVDNGLYTSEPVNARREIGFKEAFLGEKITVPNNPLYVAARIKIEYSYLYTGWDSYSSHFQPMVALFISENFRSPGFNDLPGFANQQLRWKQIALGDQLFQIWEPSEVNDFLFSKDSSFEIEGYVTPGSEIIVKAGFGMSYGNSIGVYGSYHYGEFKLKKITVIYLQANE